MVQMCCVCYSNSNNTENISFHQFPTDLKRKKKWIERLELSAPIGKFQKVCSKHFLPGSFMPRNDRKMLHSKAVPLSYEEVMNYIQIMQFNNRKLKSDENEPGPSSTYTAKTEV